MESVRHIRFFDNGAVMVLDANGQQVPKWQDNLICNHLRLMCDAGAAAPDTIVVDPLGIKTTVDKWITSVQSEVFGGSEETPSTDCPQIILQPCSCGRASCKTFVIAILKPIIKPMADDPDTLACMCHVPIELAQKIVDRIREIATSKGVSIR